MAHIDTLDRESLQHRERELAARYAALKARKLSLDLTRGKPGPEQLALSDGLDGVLDGDFHGEGGVDLRNYGGLDGIAEARRLFAPVLQVPAANVIVGGNSSLTMMYQCLLFGMWFGLGGPQNAWH